MADTQLQNRGFSVQHIYRLKCISHNSRTLATVTAGVIKGVYSVTARNKGSINIILFATFSNIPKITNAEKTAISFFSYSTRSVKIKALGGVNSSAEALTVAVL